MNGDKVAMNAAIKKAKDRLNQKGIPWELALVDMWQAALAYERKRVRAILEEAANQLDPSTAWMTNEDRADLAAKLREIIEEGER
jgi:hypothetical protein